MRIDIFAVRKLRTGGRKKFTAAWCQVCAGYSHYIYTTKPCLSSAVLQPFNICVCWVTVLFEQT